MNKKLLAGAAVTAVIGSTLAFVPLAQADTQTTVRSSDFLSSLSGTRANGLVTVGDNGAGVVTVKPAPGTTGPLPDKAAEYWATDIPLSEVHSGSLDWVGTLTQPGVQLYVNVDGSGNHAMAGADGYKGADGILVGEQVYNGDWWLNSAADDLMKSGAPQTTGGSGSAWHGTLDEWSTAFPDARIVAVGFSLGSGANDASGILKDVKVGDNTFTFAGKDAVVLPTPVTTAPANVHATTSGTTASLSWDAVPGATGYSLYRNGVSVPVGESFGTTGQVAGLQPGTAYSFQVAGHMADGTTGPKSAAVSVTTAPVTLAPVTTMYGTSVTTSSAILLWGRPDANVTGYYVFRNGVQVGYTYGTWLSNKGLKSKTSYTFQVQAVGAGGAKAPKSASFVIKTN